MRGKIKYFFWSTVCSACFLIYSSLNGKTQNQIFSSIKAIKNGAMQNLPSGMRGRFPSSVVDTSTPQHIAELKEAGLEPEQISASRNEYVKDDGNYVLIEGKYYKARADNTYDVNGRRVFYVNNRRYGQDEVDAASASASASEPQGEVDETSVKRVTADDEKLLASPQEMMQKLQKAKQEMNERNEYLKELEKEQ